MMKKLLFSLLALVLGVTTATAAATHVKVTPKSGTPVVVSFDDQPEIAFLADQLKLTAKSINPVTFSFDNVSAIEFVDQSEVASVDEGVVRMLVFQDRISFVNVAEGTPVKVFSMAGQLVKSFDATGEVNLYRSEFQPGIYAVVIGRLSFKVQL